MARRLPALITGQPYDCGGTILGEDGPLRQRTLRIKIGELGTQFLGRLRALEIDVVFLERLHYALARKHGGTGDDRCGRDSVHPYQRT